MEFKTQSHKQEQTYAYSNNRSEQSSNKNNVLKNRSSLNKYYNEKVFFEENKISNNKDYKRELTKIIERVLSNPPAIGDKYLDSNHQDITKKLPVKVNVNINNNFYNANYNYHSENNTNNTNNILNTNCSTEYTTNSKSDREKRLTNNNTKQMKRVDTLPGESTFFIPCINCNSHIPINEIGMK